MDLRAVVDFVAVKASKSHKAQQGREAGCKRFNQKHLFFTLFQQASINDLTCFGNRIAHMVRMDQDGKYFVDYLGHDPIQGGASLSDRMRDIYEQTIEDLKITSDPKVLAKLQWLKRYIMCTVEEMAGERSRLEANSNSTFGKKFKRTFDNLISYVKSSGEGESS